MELIIELNMDMFFKYGFSGGFDSMNGSVDTHLIYLKSYVNPQCLL